jgi:hypothetical protein
MRHSSRFAFGLGVAALALCAAGLTAQPPGPRSKGAPPPPPPPAPPAATAADFQTVNGTVREYTTAARGEVDGLILADGTVLHWPPPMQDRFTAIAAKGDRIRATGFRETGPAGDTKLEVSTLTNLTTNKTGDNPDRPAPAAGRATAGRGGDVEDRLQALEDKVDRLTAEVERLRRRQ